MTKKNFVALLVLLAITSFVSAQDSYPVPICPNSGTVNMSVTHIPDHILFSGQMTTDISFYWDIGKFPDAENWLLEIWIWDGSKDGYTVYDTVPLGREFWTLDAPFSWLMEDPPQFYVRHIYESGYKRCGRTQWYIGDTNEMTGQLPPVAPGSAWVYDEGTNRMELKQIVLKDKE